MESNHGAQARPRLRNPCGTFLGREVLLFRSRAMTAITRDLGDSPHPTRPFPSFVANKSICSIRPKRDPRVTQGSRLGDPIPNPIPTAIGRGSQIAHKHKSQRNLRCVERACASKYQVPTTKYLCPYPTLYPSRFHARTSSPVQVMSFATLCLTLVHVFSTRVGQLTAYRQNFKSRSVP